MRVTTKTHSGRVANLIATLAAVAMLGFGCASPNVNPPRPKAHTGYVDFDLAVADELALEVREYRSGTNSFKTLYFDVRPVQNEPLRLALAPGRHRLRVTCVNRAINHPAEIEVEVDEGKITPLRLTLTDVGVVLVRTKELGTGSTAYGRYGRRTKIGSDETVLYDVSLAVEPPVAYQPKEHMDYAP
jgi:hypothetical protein